jgi:hypothetical protein
MAFWDRTIQVAYPHSCNTHVAVSAGIDSGCRGVDFVGGDLRERDFKLNGSLAEQMARSMPSSS